MISTRQWQQISVPDTFALHGGKDAYDALGCRSLSANQPLITGLFCGKRYIKIRHPMRGCHPVSPHTTMNAHTQSRTLLTHTMCKNTYA